MAEELRTLRIVADGQAIDEPVRIHVRGKSTMTCLPDPWQVDIYNLSAGGMAILRKAEKISVIGKRDSVLCEGKPIDITRRQEDVHQITTLLIVDGDAFWRATVALAIHQGADAEISLRAILDHSTYSIPLAAFPRMDLKLPRGQTFFGRTADAVSSFARAFGCRAYVFHDSLHVCALGVGTAEMTIIDDDLIEEPMKMQDAVSVATDVIGVMVGRRVTVKHEEIGGVYRLAAQTIDADNRSGPWRCELTLIDEMAIASEGGRWEGIT